MGVRPHLHHQTGGRPWLWICLSGAGCLNTGAVRKMPQWRHQRGARIMPASTCGTLTERLMAWRLGRIQRGCLRVIEEYEAAGKRPTTFNIAAEVYRVRRDQCGNRMVSDAQHFSTERALASLGRKGLVTGHGTLSWCGRYWMAAASAAVCGR